MLWDKLVNFLISIGFPLVCFYHTLSSNIFLNVAAQDAKGLEKCGDILLTPFQYLFAGKEAIYKGNEWEFVQRFDYRDHFIARTGVSIAILPPSLLLGSIIKGAAYYFSPYQERHTQMKKCVNSSAVRPNDKLYREMGLSIISPDKMEPFFSQGFSRRPGDENHLKEAKEALQNIAELLNENQIPWWVDCGTCLGAYRYGGVIPWDEDIDIAVLLPDFENVFRTLKQLPSEKYVVQDCSGREYPKSYLRIYIRKTNTVIDIYHFDIDPINQQLKYILSLEHNIFMPNSWKIRERRFKAPVSYQDVFPLKKGVLDGIEVFVPQNPKKYLQRCYGEDLSPAKLYSTKTNTYEKNLSHPYWANKHVH